MTAPSSNIGRQTDGLVERLLPCPFCGSDEAIVESISASPANTPKRWFTVECITCSAEVGNHESGETARHQWNTRIQQLEADNAAMREAGQALVAKLDECAPHINDAFLHRQLRCGDYDGPQFGEALNAFRAALNTGAAK